MDVPGGVANGITASFAELVKTGALSFSSLILTMIGEVSKIVSFSVVLYNST